MQLWLDPAADQVPGVDTSVPFIAYDGIGFGPWSSHTITAIERPVTRLKWCYFGANSAPDEATFRPARPAFDPPPHRGAGPARAVGGVLPDLASWCR